MIQHQLKLKPTKAQEKTLNDWLWHLTGVWNWAIRKIELDAQGGIYYTKQGFANLLAGHSDKMEIPSHTIQGMLCDAWTAWKRCFKKIAKKPRLKGKNNRLNSIPFPDPFKAPKGNRIAVPAITSVRFHKQAIPKGNIKCGRIVKRASGWYLCLFIDAQPNPIAHTDNLVVGIDPGFSSLITLSNGEKIAPPKEYEKMEERLAQVQRGRNNKKIARLQERIANQRKDRNHKLSHDLTARCDTIFFSNDNDKALSKSFGKSVSSAGHGQLKQMLSYKMPTSGRRYVEVSNRNSTKRCSTCGVLSGPTGLGNLAVRHWVCACGAHNDRDINSAINTLNAGLGLSHESGSDAASGNGGYANAA